MTTPTLRDRGRLPRHPATVRVTHWITAACVLALLISGMEIVVSHPRFYWGEVGSVMTEALFEIPIPASRSAVRTGYDFVLPDQNGWSRSLHFQSAWAVVAAGLAYLVFGLWTRHFHRKLLPNAADLSPRSLSGAVADHLRFKPPTEAEAWSYNVLQRIAYLAVIFVLFPLVIWTGLAMSPAVVSAFPFTVTAFGGQQSARTIHFLVTVALSLFLLVHVVMVWLAGFRNRVRAMVTGRVEGPVGASEEHA
jgi:thiosulfate reductase cytochrome b subunit